MISVLIRVKHGPEALAVTLSALVPAVAAGLVGDAVVLAGEADGIVARVADAAGAELVVTSDNSWRQGAVIARRDWLLCLDDGDVLAEGWIHILERFAAFGHPDRAGRLRRKSGSPLQAIADRVRRLVGVAPTCAGFLVHRKVLLGEVRASATVTIPAVVERDPFFLGGRPAAS